MFVNLFLTVVVSFYMLIDGKRIFRFICRLAPGEPEVKEDVRAGPADRLQPLRPRTGPAGRDHRSGLRTGHLDPELGHRGRLAGGRPVRPALRRSGRV